MEWLPDTKYKKGIFLLQGAITEILNPLRMYGQGDYVSQAIVELVKLAEDWGIYVRGKDKPINVKYLRRKKNK